MLGASIGAAFAVDLTSAQAAYDKGDFEDAFKQFLSMAEQGNGLAQSSTGVMYDMGQGTTKDYDKAVEWYKKSAEQGNQFGQFNLGTMYYMGTGVAKDILTACKWFVLSTRQGNGQARIHMHICAPLGFRPLAIGRLCAIGTAIVMALGLCENIKSASAL